MSMDSHRQGWAEVVRLRRDQFAMTQAQLADAADVSLKTITNLETSGVTPQRGTLMKIRRALGLPGSLEEAAALAAAAPSGLAGALGSKPSPPLPPSGMDRYLEDLEARLLNLEERVASIEGGMALAGRALVGEEFTHPGAEVVAFPEGNAPDELDPDEPVAAFDDPAVSIEAEQEAPDTP